jgi:peptide/nickel transport system permease protein
MLRYILNRIIYLLPVLFLISIVVFLFIHLMPGDPIDYIMGVEATEAARRALRTELGLDHHILVQYFIWAGKVFTGDFGKSIITHEPVLKIIIEKFPATFLLAFAATVVSSIIAILAGTFAAIHRGTWKDLGALILSLLWVSIPIFWLGIMLILFFSLYWPLFPTVGFVSPFDSLPRCLHHLTLPAITLGTGLAGATARLCRSEMIEQLGKDYVITAKAKGLSPWGVNYKHALRNALISVVTFTGIQLGTLLGGAVVVEQIFTWPGLGLLVIQSIFARDYPLVQGIVLFMAFIFVFVNLLVDISYTWLNPQMRFERRE